MTYTTQRIEPETIALPKRGMPVTIITGFLGSGKTTLLNQILQNKQNLKVAVLVNEFGDINIDSQLLVSLDQDMVELSNGCICCTINDGLLEAVYRVIEREDPVDYLVIETTGIADPLPIALTFLGAELRDLTRLDSILTVIDAEIFTPDHFDSEAAFKQVAYGDIVLLNKTDRTDSKKLQELEDYIQTVKYGARILHCQYGQVPLPLILDVGLTPIDDYIKDYNPHDTHEHHDHDHDHDHHHHSHHLQNDGFVSMSFQSDRPFDVNKFEIFLTQQMPTNVFRAKGILWFSDSEFRHIFQLSGPRYELNPDEWRSCPHNQVVFIGRHLNTDEITEQLNHCLAS
ncbi:MAG TPA: cobalamin biosynthesis protein CobW [Cyanobacteria bacterium UBA12227]|nr:cobalamin biosynthesis protein CobW [Cyanobacteria bacterium UBA12227]HAX85022.1 cobalamin biosynthesis protein CobW [Cyanobacteria bacterium UBA11370]HBY78858.1 cobalamin biosynthesis protein CobW [Cyanobacteria bacterium UBA11148]